MDFFRNLFKQEPQKFEKITKNPIINPQHPEKIPLPDIKSYLQQHLSPIYWQESDSIVTTELDSISSPEDIGEKISQLQEFLNLSQNCLLYELDLQSDKFSEHAASLQTLSSLITDTKDQTTSTKALNEHLQKALAENYIKILYLSKRTNNLNLLLKEFSQFQHFADVFFTELNKSIRESCFIRALECCEKAKEIIGDPGYGKYKVFEKVSECLENAQKSVVKEMNEKLIDAFFYNFEPGLYENLILAYVFISPAEQTLRIFQGYSGIINKSVLMAFSKAVPNLPVSTADYMIRITPNSSYSLVIMNVLKNLTELLHNFYLVLEWHNENQ